jgi:hypothetical protein
MGHRATEPQSRDRMDASRAVGESAGSSAQRMLARLGEREVRARGACSRQRDETQRHKDTKIREDEEEEPRKGNVKRNLVQTAEQRRGVAVTIEPVVPVQTGQMGGISDRAHSVSALLFVPLCLCVSSLWRTNAPCERPASARRRRRPKDLVSASLRLCDPSLRNTNARLHANAPCESHANAPCEWPAGARRRRRPKALFSLALWPCDPFRHANASCDGPHGTRPHTGTTRTSSQSAAPSP